MYEAIQLMYEVSRFTTAVRWESNELIWIRASLRSQVAVNLPLASGKSVPTHSQNEQYYEL